MTAAHLLLAGAVAVLLATVATGAGSPRGSAAALVLGVGTAAAGWAGVRRQTTRNSGLPWLTITLSLVALGYVLEGATGAGPGFSVGDVCALTAYGSLCAALLARTYGGQHSGRARTQAALDGAVALVVSALVLWHTSRLLPGDDGHSTALRLAWAAFPVLDAIALGLVAWRTFHRRRVRLPATLLALGVLVWLITDLTRLFVPASADGPADAGRLAGAVLIATVLWARPARGPRMRAQAVAAISTGRLTATFLPLLVPTGFEVLAWLRGTEIDPLPGLLASGALVVLIMIRSRRIIIDSEQAWATVRSQARRFEALAMHSSDAVVVLDGHGRLIGESRSLAGLLGVEVPLGENLARALSAFAVEPRTVQDVLARARSHPGTVLELQLPGRWPSGEPLWLGGRAVDLLDNPDVHGIAMSLHDITPRKLAEEELAHQAFHDGLTGLPNRVLFLDRVEQALHRAGRSGAAPIVLCLDLDGFKDVNDSLGHLAGDELLRTVAVRLQDVVRGADTVARLGGDEFVVLVDDNGGGIAEASALAGRLLHALGEPIVVAGQRVTISASVGIVVAEPEATPIGLLRDADIAMYRAKAAGRSQWVVFAPHMRTAELERIELERDLAGALAAGQFWLAYQPVIDLQTDEVVGFEALLRWDHPELGVVGPDRFVPIAEDSDLIVPIGRWVLTEATATLARWQADHPVGVPLSMAVNVSARQLASPDLVGHVREALAASGITPHALVLEVTETALVTDPVAVAEQLALLRGLGVRLALDDFGTGYSSLSYLRQFAVDILKIDRSFVGTLTAPGDDAAILHGLLQLSRRMQLEVVAEGVELPVQRDVLRAEGCALAQGFLFSPPLDAAAAELLLLRRHPAALPPAPRAAPAGSVPQLVGD